MTARPATPKPKRLKPAKPITARKLAKAAWRELKTGFKRYALIIGVVAVPQNLISLSASLAGNSTVTIVVNLAILTMNVVLIWAMVEREKTGVIPGPLTAYYDGSITLVRSVVVYAILLVMLIPLAIASSVYVLLLMGAEYGITTAAEEVLIGSICLLISLISFWLLARYLLAVIGVIADNLRPIAAVRFARQLTLGRFWRVVGRLAMLVLMLAVISIPISGVTALLTALKLPTLGAIVFKLVTSMVALPFAYAYLLALYRDLSASALVAPNPHDVAAEAVPAEAAA